MNCPAPTLVFFKKNVRLNLELPASFFNRRKGLAPAQFSADMPPRPAILFAVRP